VRGVPSEAFFMTFYDMVRDAARGDLAVH